MSVNSVTPSILGSGADSILESVRTMSSFEDMVPELSSSFPSFIGGEVPDFDLEAGLVGALDALLERGKSVRMGVLEGDFPIPWTPSRSIDLGDEKTFVTPPPAARRFETEREEAEFKKRFRSFRQFRDVHNMPARPPPTPVRVARANLYGGISKTARELFVHPIGTNLVLRRKVARSLLDNVPQRDYNLSAINLDPRSAFYDDPRANFRGFVARRKGRRQRSPRQYDL